MTSGNLYEALGWTQGSAYWRRRSEDAKLSLLIRVAHVVGAPFGLYVEDVFRELWRRAPTPKARRIMPRPTVPGSDAVIRAVSDFKARVRAATSSE
jgi:hypothetical protein